MQDPWANFNPEQKKLKDQKWADFNPESVQAEESTSPYAKEPWFNHYLEVKSGPPLPGSDGLSPEQKDKAAADYAKSDYELKQKPSPKDGGFSDLIKEKGGWGLSEDTRKFLGGTPEHKAGSNDGKQQLKDIIPDLADLAYKTYQGAMTGLEVGAVSADNLLDKTGIPDLTQKYLGHKLQPGHGLMALMEAFPDGGLAHGFVAPKGDVLSPEVRASLNNEAGALFEQGASLADMNAWAKKKGMTPFGKDLAEKIEQRDLQTLKEHGIDPDNMPGGPPKGEALTAAVNDAKSLKKQTEEFTSSAEPKAEEVFKTPEQKQAEDTATFEDKMKADAEKYKTEEPSLAPVEPYVTETGTTKPVDTAAEDEMLLSQYGLRPSHFSSPEEMQGAVEQLRSLTKNPRETPEPISYDGPVRGSEPVTEAPSLTKRGAGAEFKQELQKDAPKALTPTQFGKKLEADAAEFLKTKEEAPKPVPETVPETPSKPSSTAPEKPDTVAPHEEVVERLTKAINNASRIGRKVQDKLYSQARRERLAKARGIRERIGGEEGHRAALSALEGKLPRADFEGVRDQFTTEEIKSLFDHIASNPKLFGFEPINAQTGLRKLLDGELPQASEIKVLDRVFPASFIKAVAKNKSLKTKFSEGLASLLNLPRALKSSMDLSAPFTQGVFMVGRKEFWKSFGPMIKSFASEKAYVKVMDEIRHSPNYPWMEEAKLALTDIHGSLTNREEAFMSRIAEKVPGVIRSERAYTTFLNKLRADSFNSILEKAKKTGLKPEDDPKFIKDLGSFINNATGRGDLGRFNSSSPLLSGVLFSPRLMAARVNMLRPDTYIRLHPLVRKEALKSLLAFGGIATTVGALSAAAGANVELDPRSSDFMKVKIGNTRYNILGGYGQYMTLAARLASNEKKTISGDTQELGSKFGSSTRYGVSMEFLRTKFSPVASFVADWADQKNVIGEPFEIKKEVASSFMPMFFSDLHDLIKEEGFVNGSVMSVPGLFGLNSQTYLPRPEKDKKDKWSEFNPENAQ